MTRRTSATWTFLITALALFMVSLDNLVVTMALPVIRQDLGASLADLEWIVNEGKFPQDVIDICWKALRGEFPKKPELETLSNVAGNA